MIRIIIKKDLYEVKRISLRADIINYQLIIEDNAKAAYNLCLFHLLKKVGMLKIIYEEPLVKKK